MTSIISCNVNGLKAYYEKGALDELISKFNPDILCIQETKCSEANVGYWICHHNYTYIPFSNSNHFKKGYAGVATFIREELKTQIKSVEMPDILDEYGEGRIVTVEFQDYYLVNVYTLNSGNKNDLRIEWDKRFKHYIMALKSKGNVVIVGDLNIVPSQLDYWSDFDAATDSYPGLMQFERDGYAKLISECNLIDTFRKLQPETRSYSWYSYRGGARELNHGWRIDLGLVSDKFIDNVIDSKVHSEFEGSDHTPIELIIK